MGIDLIAHVCIPLLAGLVLILFVAAAEEQPISWASCNDIGIDLAILSIGANGAIFVNPVLIKHWGGATGVYGILVVLADLVYLYTENGGAILKPSPGGQGFSISFGDAWRYGPLPACYILG